MELRLNVLILLLFFYLKTFSVKHIQFVTWIVWHTKLNYKPELFFIVSCNRRGFRYIVNVKIVLLADYVFAFIYLYLYYS